MVLTVAVVARGVKSGLEKAVRVLMPALFGLLLLMVGYAMNSGHFGEGLAFLFTPDFSALTADGLLAAMGQAFFSLSLGMGAIMVYGSYLPAKTSIANASLVIVLADTLVAILAGIAIFPIVFAYGLEPAAGPGLVFEVLPLAFGHIPGGTLFASVFFLLLLFAAWTSAISLVEPAVAWLVENNGLNRVTAATLVGVAVWLLGLLTLLSFNLWSDFKPLAGMTLFDMLDYLTSNIMLPLGGLLIALFAGYFMPGAISREELNLNEGLYRLWFILVRYVAPVAVLMVFLNAIGVL
jgi:NSS family neurotransmitter:Na+ symporter